MFPKLIGGRQYPPEAWKPGCSINCQRLFYTWSATLKGRHYRASCLFRRDAAKATQDAGYMAGFEVMDIINEPTAAAIAFRLSRRFLERRE